MDYGKLALKRIAELSDAIGEAAGSPATGGKVGLAVEDYTGIKILSKTLDFRTSAEGDVTLSLSGHLTGPVFLAFYFDGCAVYHRRALAGWLSEKITLTMVEKGSHAFKINILSENEFDLTDLNMTAEGKIPSLDGDFFIEAFSDGSAYIFRRFGSLEIFAGSGNDYSLENTIGGISYARTAGESEQYVAAVTDKGLACLIGFGSGYSSPDFHAICRGARAIAATEKTEGFLEVFVATEKEILHYRFDMAGGYSELCGKTELRCNDLAAVTVSDVLYLFAGNNGYCTLNRLGRSAESTSDTFYVYTSREDR